MPYTPFQSVIQEILGCRVFAVVGVSRDPAKYGHMVFAALKDHGYTVYPVNPSADSIGDDVCYPRLDTLPEAPECVVTVVPPSVTEKVAREAGRLGARYMWMQPGSESEAAVNAAQAAGLRIVHGGPCLMVAVKTWRAP
ncbi:MAG: CoA-binding protein [Armatimonadetes bacterium]|nr:CoA-binding protein [Armatimonadota bacterium]